MPSTFGAPRSQLLRRTRPVAELLHALGVDGKLLLAQVVNFGILAAILTKFLYRPMLRTLDERRAQAAEIAASAKEVAEARRQAEQRLEDSQREAREAAAVILKEARDDATRIRADALAKVEREIAALRERTLSELAREKERIVREVHDELAGIALLAAEKVLERSVRSEDTERLAREAIAAISRAEKG